MKALSIWLTIQTVLMVSEGVATTLGWAMPIIKPRPLLFVIIHYVENNSLQCWLYYLTNFILKDLTEEKEMKLLHLLKNTQTDRMKTHKKKEKRKNKHTFIYVLQLHQNQFFWLPIISSMLESSINRHGNRCEFQSLKVIFTGFLLLLTWERTNLMNTVTSIRLWNFKDGGS